MEPLEPSFVAGSFTSTMRFENENAFDHAEDRTEEEAAARLIAAQRPPFFVTQPNYGMAQQWPGQRLPAHAQVQSLSAELPPRKPTSVSGGTGEYRSGTDHTRQISPLGADVGAGTGQNIEARTVRKNRMICEDCNVRVPHWGYKEERMRRWCAKCGQANHPGSASLSKPKMCEVCEQKQPSYGLPDEGKTRWCANCAAAVCAGAQRLRGGQQMGGRKPPNHTGSSRSRSARGGGRSGGGRRSNDSSMDAGGGSMGGGLGSMGDIGGHGEQRLRACPLLVIW